MRILNLVIAVLAIGSCVSNQRADKIAAQSVEQLVKPAKTFTNCFAHADTVGLGPTVGCGGGIYKLLNDKYIIHLKIERPLLLDSCYTISIDSMRATLLVFEDKKASLLNICTDVVMINAPSPIRKLKAASGEIVVKYSDPVKYYGVPTHHITMFIKTITFIDPVTGNKIEFENELLWKVLDMGELG